jgi:signal transduction histidine kinase
VEAHGGRITAISDGPGTGTTMTVFLPLGLAS